MGRMKELSNPTYPERAGYAHDSETSKAAAERTDNSAAAMREKVWSYIRKKDATCDEVEVALDMKHQTASARIRELVLGKRLVDTGLTRKTRSGSPARIYRAVTPAEQGALL